MTEADGLRNVTASLDFSRSAMLNMVRMIQYEEFGVEGSGVAKPLAKPLLDIRPIASF